MRGGRLYRNANYSKWACSVASHDMAGDPFCDRDYEALATFRYELRRFVRFSEEAAIAAGLTPQHYQVLLTLRASPDGAMLVGALAGRLLLRPHSTPELVNRLEQIGQIGRHHAPDDRRTGIGRSTGGDSGGR